MISLIYDKWNDLTHWFEKNLFNCGEAMRRKLVESSRSKMTFREFFSLLWLNTVVMARNAVEFVKVAAKYYWNISFLKADIALRLMYFFHNPFSISKRFLMHKGEKEVYAYGETPLTSMEIIAREAQIGPQDCVYELGSGRGRNCFWLNSLLGCSVVGIEFIPEFVERANRIKDKLDFKGVEFRLGDMCEADYSGATVCYLYGTCLDDASIRKLMKKFEKLPLGTKIITVSYSLMDYTDKPFFEVMKRFTVPFTWGEADVYIHVVK